MASSAAGQRAPAGSVRRPTRAGVRAAGAAALDPGQIAWLAAIPCALVVVLAIVVLGEPLGELLFPASTFTFYPEVAPILLPEPTEQARYLIALSGPILLSAVVAGLARRSPRLRGGAAAALVTAAQALAATFVVVCVVVQRGRTFGVPYYDPAAQMHVVYFTAATLVVALLLAVGMIVLLRSAAARGRWERWTRDSRGRAIGAFLVALGLTVLWLLPAVELDDTIADANFNVLYHAQFTFDEAMAVVDGRSPLGDFAVQYGSLWSYLFGGGMALFGTSLGVYTVLVALVGGLALLAVFALLRRLTGRSLAALLLFLPVLATAMYVMQGPLDVRYAISNLYGTFPMRYAGPLLLAWLTTRHLDGAQPRKAWPVFLFGGLVVLNNADFGVPAFGATVAAIVWSQERLSWRWAGRLAVQVLLGLALAYALVAALLLARTGALPDLGLLVRYARMFAVAGFAMLPTQAIGLQTILYLTFAGAIVTATVRALRGAPERPLTGMLAWSGIFGLGAGAYYIGRSHPEVLTNLFGAWALSLALLTIVVVRALACRQGRAPAIAEVAVLLGFAIAVCSLAQAPLPWQQLDRLQTTAQARPYDPVAQEAFIAANVEPGESVAILPLLGHRMAHDVGVESVTPYSGLDSMPTVEQLHEAVDALRAAGGTKVFTAMQPAYPSALDELAASGFLVKAQDDQSGLLLWVEDPSLR